MPHSQSNTSLKQQPLYTKSWYPWLAIGLCALFLFYKYILQFYPSVMTNPIMRSFHIHATGLGNLAATFFYSYMLMQLFVGILMDRYGTRYLSMTAILFCACGAFLFAYAHTLLLAVIARVFMGIGAAFATVCYLKITAVWFSPKQFAFVSGLLLTAAMLGAFCGESVIAWMMQYMSWRDTLLLIALLGLVLAITVGLLLHDKNEQTAIAGSDVHAIVFKDIITLLHNKKNWLLLLYSGLTFAPVTVFTGLWGNPFLQQSYHLSNTAAAALLSVAFMGMAIGAPLLGWLSATWIKRKTMMMYAVFIQLMSVMTIIYCHPLPMFLLTLLLILFGISTSAFMLAFAIGKESNPLYLAGTVVALINTGDALFGAFSEPLVGKFLDLQWQHGNMMHGAPIFLTSSYEKAFALLPVYLIIAAIILWQLKDTQST